MDKKPAKSKDKSVCHSSERLIDKIFQRFKFTKRTSSTSIVSEEAMPQNINHDSRISIHKPTGEDEQRNEPEYQRITPDDLGPFSERLGKFLQYVQGIQELSYSVYEYPSELQIRLEKDINELDSIYKEVRAASLNAKLIKQQRKAVHKEISGAKKMLQKLKNEETQELEGILQIYDKPMFIRWENLKNTRKPDLLKSLLFDVNRKQDALEGLSKLIENKLPRKSPIGTLFEFGSLSSKDKAQLLTEATVTPRRGLVTPQRPHRQDTINDTNAKMQSYVTEVKNRMLLRRRRAPDSQTRVGGENVAFGPQQELTTITVGPMAPPAITVTPATSVSDRSLDTSSSGSVSAITPPKSDSASNMHETIGFASEMQTVLQALFHGMRQEGGNAINGIETITVDDDSPSGSVTSHNDNVADENSTDENNVVQLFSFSTHSHDQETNN